MRVKVSNHIRITNPSPEIITWCQTNLRLPNPDYAKKSRMGFWVGNTPKDICLYEFHGGELVIPYGCLKSIAPLLTDAVVESDFKTSVSIDYGDSIPLYPYQEKAVEQAQNGLYGILQSKAGSGKTQMGIALVKQFGKRALWLTHTKDLCNQSKERAERYMDKSLIGTITEGKVNIGSGITFATVQTMSHLNLTLYKDYWDVIIVDECHRVCGSPTQLSMFSKVLNTLSARHKYGLSATVHRADGMIKATFALLGEVVCTVPDEAIADKVMRVGIKPIGTGVGISRECLNTDGTLNYTKLINYLCDNFDRHTVIHDAIVNESDHSCLILSDRLTHLENLMALLPPTMKPYAVMISGKMTSKKGKAEREQALEDMRTGKKKYLFATYSLAAEGMDIPNLERLFMATPIKDYARVIQSIGRIARTHEGKASPICYDFIDQMGYTEKLFKQRLRHYRKGGCYLCEEHTE